MTAMRDTMMMTDTIMNDKDRFTVTELQALRSDLLQGGMIDSFEAAELLQIFLRERLTLEVAEQCHAHVVGGLEAPRLVAFERLGHDRSQLGVDPGQSARQLGNRTVQHLA